MSVRGFAMIEVLVAMTVAALGLGAALAMALGGLAATVEARRADLATVLAADLAGRIRALPGADWTALPEPVECGTGCTPAQLAALEYVAWRDTLQARLPGADARLEAGAGDAVRLSLDWPETGATTRSLHLEIHR